MSQYKNLPTGFAVLRKKLIIVSATFIPLIILFTTVTIYFSNNTEINWEVLLFTIGFVFIVLSYSMVNTVKRQKSIYSSYTLTIENDYLLRQQNNLPPLTINKKEITQIIRGKNGSLLVKGQKPNDYICISPSIENYTEVENSLKSVHPIIDFTSKNILQKYPYLGPVIVIGLMGTIYIADNKLLF